MKDEELESEGVGLVSVGGDGLLAEIIDVST